MCSCALCAVWGVPVGTVFFRVSERRLAVADHLSPRNACKADTILCKGFRLLKRLYTIATSSGAIQTAGGWALRSPSWSWESFGVFSCEGGTSPDPHGPRPIRGPLNP